MTSIFLTTTALSLGMLCANAYALDKKPTTQPTETKTQAKMQIIKNQSPDEAFLTTNKAKNGVITLPDGLQYKIIKIGKGTKPSATDTVTVNYEGKLIDGTIFDSSYQRGVPISFPVSGVIPGWVEALQLMPIGSIWELYIPANLAYGEQGAPPTIGPNKTLIFKVELLKIGT
jgi:FKBP-type peptidyl-prolyl cis-trans isomerase FklB